MTDPERDPLTEPQTDTGYVTIADIGTDTHCEIDIVVNKRLVLLYNSLSIAYSLVERASNLATTLEGDSAIPTPSQSCI